MTKPPSSVRSIRLPNDIWAQLVAEAEKSETTVNQLMHSYAIVGLLKSAEGRARAANPEQIAKPLKPKAKPAEKGGAQPAPASPPKLSLQVGPTTATPGSRLKTPKR